MKINITENPRPHLTLRDLSRGDLFRFAGIGKAVCMVAEVVPSSDNKRHYVNVEEGSASTNDEFMARLDETVHIVLDATLHVKF